MLVLACRAAAAALMNRPVIADRYPDAHRAPTGWLWRRETSPPWQRWRTVLCWHAG